MSTQQEQNIIKALKKNRPNLSDSSINSYLTSLRKIYRDTRSVGDELSVDYFINNADKILAHIHDLKNTTRKTKLASLVVICGSHSVCKKYRDPMMEDIKEINEETKQNTRNEREANNWISQEEVDAIYNQYEKFIKPIATKIRKGEELDKKELFAFQNFITLALYVLNPPRRIQDYILFKIKNIDTKTDNYLKGNKFIFNKYKTSTIHGCQEVDVHPMLLKYLKLWLKVNPTDYLLFDTRMTSLSQPQLTQRLNNIFGRRVSVNMLRHIIITEEHGENIEQIHKLAHDMGHNVNTQKTYIKK